jgi:predicted DNA-binding transcriptional regulator AlpA
MRTSTAPIALETALGGAVGPEKNSPNLCPVPQPPIIPPGKRNHAPSALATARLEKEPAAARAPPAADDLLTSGRVKAALGGVSEMTLWRWSRQRDFPLPDLIVARRKFWRRSTVQAWIAAQVEKTANERVDQGAQLHADDRDDARPIADRRLRGGGV